MEFSYKAQAKTGDILEGVVDAKDEDMAVNILHGKGYIVLTLDPIKSDIFSTDLNQIFSVISSKDIVIFTRQLSTLIDADMPLNEGLRTLAQQAEKPNLQAVISDISEMVEGGSSLSSAFSKYPKLFSQFYVKLVQSGEISGKMQDSLLFLADHMERSRSINSKMKGALAYPAFIVFAMTVVGAIMTIYVLPQLLDILKEADVAELPLTTTVLIMFTDFINSYLVLLIVLFVAAVVMLVYYTRTDKGRVWLDNVKIRIPALGGVVRSLYLARIAESLSTLIKSGIPILETMKITADLVGNSLYRDILLNAEVLICIV